MFLRPFILLFISIFFLEAKDITIQKSINNLEIKESSAASNYPIKIAIITSSKVIGKYAQSTYNVSLATLMSYHHKEYEIKQYDLQDESTASLSQVLDSIHQDGMNAILAPLTASGARNFTLLTNDVPVFIPTVHKRDIPLAPKNIVFGGIDYIAQMEALRPYMGDSIAIFYDNSNVGTQLKSITEELFLHYQTQKKKITTYPVNLKGDNIITHLSKPSLFNKASVIIHLPVVKSALLTAHMTFTGIKERNILSTQINIDPTLLTLTQYQDRKNMILANSLIEFPSTIYESNALMGHDISLDWIQYATSVGIDYLIAHITNTDRQYTMRIINSQIIYPVELLRAKEFGFEPIISHE